MRVFSTRSTTLIAAAIVALSAASVQADDKSEIRALYVKLSKAIKAKDIKRVMATGTADFTNKNPGSPAMSAKQSAEMMEQGFKMMKSVEKVEMTPVKITVNGKTAMVASKFEMKGTMAGPDGKTMVMADKGTGREKLVKTAKGWLFKSAETLTSKPTMNGKPMEMEMPTPAPPSSKKLAR
jgi:ketosteroid isomerase-like protein